MTSRQQAGIAVAKPWGSSALPPAFAGYAGDTGERIGEIWYEADETDALLVKHLFTSERLSIQVHPDDAAAQARGHRRGKDEAWLVLHAQPGATIGLGLRQAVSREALRAAALDGSIEQLIDWRPVSAGDFFYSPAGTVHALGAGLTILEIQQNLDLTYRLYDYGRPRELHLDEGVAVADPSPWRPIASPVSLANGRELLVSGAQFVVERWTLDAPAGLEAGGLPMLLTVESGQVEVDGAAGGPGSVWAIDGAARIVPQGGAALLIAYPGAEPRTGARA